MPYKSMDEVNKAIRGIKPAVSLEQANLIAEWADKLEGQEGVESPWGTAIANFKKFHYVEGGQWVRNKQLEHLDDERISALSEMAAKLNTLSPDEAFEALIGHSLALEGKVTKSEGGKAYPASDYLVVEDPEKPTTWHLRITKEPGGEPDHDQCGAAWAALHEGYRGNKYEGPNKAEAIKKLKAIYKSHKWPLPGEVSAEESYEDIERRVRDAVYAQFHSKNSPSESLGPYVKETYSDYTIMEKDGKLLKVPYTIDESGQVVFGEPEEVKEKKNYIATEDLRYFGLLELEEDQTPDFARNKNPDGTPKWVPLHQLGEWTDDRYGHFTMTKTKMEQAASNFLTCAHRPNSPIDAQVPIDTRHQGDAACAWLQEMRIELPYLWGRPAWTDRGRQVVLDKQYRYISPRYLDDPQKGPIFLEVTLTNRDFLKMPPLDGAGPNIFLSDDAQAIVITKEVNVDKLKVKIGGEEKELTLEEVQALAAEQDKADQEIARLKVELEKAKVPQGPAKPQAITLTDPVTGQDTVLTAGVVAGMMADMRTLRAERKASKVREVLKELQGKNVEPIIGQMVEPILQVLDPDAQADFIQLEAGPVAKAYGFSDEAGNAKTGQMNLWTALVKVLEQIPARSNTPRSTMSDGVRLPNEAPRELGQYDPMVAPTAKELEEATKAAQTAYQARGITPRSLQKK